jgi:DNA primase
MVKLSIEDYLLFMFSMKGLRKRVDFKHITQKVERDLKIKSEAKIRGAVDDLINKNFLEEKNGLIGITKNGEEFFSKRIEKIEKDIEKVNKPWLIVYHAKRYYPVVCKTILDFCKDRYVGFYALFTDKRFFRRDFRGKKITIKNFKELMFFINIHYIDVIPSVHRIGVDRPDWLVVDIDPGEKVDFEITKEVARITYKIFEKLKLNPALKFSGSRGFQVWSLIEKFDLPEEYQPLKLRGERKRERNYFSFFADCIRMIQKEVDKELPKVTTSDIALPKDKRKNLILLDSSSMKPMGLVRCPYGVHSKTGLVSMPISIKEIEKFNPKDASMKKVMERYKKKGNEFILKKSDPKNLIGYFV